jgi:succinate dehydrogenase/fumarate reductase flavoprotein subunit
VILATGGYARMYLPSTVSLGTTGDGQALAYQCGARLTDMEMVQFHPTVFPRRQSLLITEATLGAGAEIVNQKGEVIQQSKRIPRDRLCLSIAKAFGNGDGGVFLDLKPIGKDRLMSLFPQTYELVRLVAGLDVTKDLIPIHPVAHRPMGGIETTASGETSVRGLFAVGECACNGLNGAGRLAGNTLTEAVVFGKKVGEAAAAYAKTAAKKSVPTSRLTDEERRIVAITSQDSAADTAGKIHSELGQLMTQRAGLARDASGLQSALEEIKKLRDRHQKIRVKNPSKIYNYELTNYLEVGSMLTLAEVVLLSAQARAESRGAHRRTDFPNTDNDNWKNHTVAKRVKNSPQVEKKPVAN